MSSFRNGLGAAALGVALCLGTARAQVSVSDGGAYLRWTQQIASMKQQYDEMVRTYNSLSHFNPRALLTGQGLQTDAMRLPGSVASAMPGLNFGTNLSSAGQQAYDQNHLYTTKGNDWSAQEMQRRERATANIQGEAMTGMQRAQQRIASLTELETAIPQQPDVQATSAMNARINAEKTYLANEGNNMQRLQLLQQTQGAVDQQRAQQRSRQQSEQWGASVAGQAWGG